MSADTDFAALYRELGIDPGDGMDAFRRAWRRRVGELHPDRRNDGSGIDLQRLNALYASAIRFHRQYGRLPGTPAPAIASEATAHARTAASNDGPAPARNPRARAGYLLVIALALLVVLLSARQRTPDAPAAQPGTGAVATGVPTPAPAPDARTLDIGSSMRDVLDVHGRPVNADGNRWIYGPSWVRFECLELVDWYSSPLHPLKTRSSRPSPQAQRMHRPARPENCGKTALP